MKTLENKVVLITGATRGIGKGIVEYFAAQGAEIAFSYAGSVDKANALVEKISEQTKIKAYQSDAGDFDAAQELVASVLEDFGKIDVVINNAGITRDNLLLRMGKEDFDKVIETNLNSVFNLTKAVIKPMMKARGGSIINMTSVVGIKGNAGQANYAASKAGVIGFTKSVALELGSRNIRCNAVAPGFIETEMTDALDENTRKEWTKNIPLQRGGTPEDIAKVCLFLASDLSSYVTGQVLNVDGGMLT